jgi:hypothetical protein
MLVKLFIQQVALLAAMLFGIAIFFGAIINLVWLLSEVTPS